MLMIAIVLHTLGSFLAFGLGLSLVWFPPVGLFPLGFLKKIILAQFLFMSYLCLLASCLSLPLSFRLFFSFRCRLRPTIFQLLTKKQLNRSWKTTPKKNGSIDGLQGWLVVSCILKWINLNQMTPLIHYVVQTNAPFFNSEQDTESWTTTGTGLMHPAHRFAETVRIPMRQQNTCCWNAQGWLKPEKNSCQHHPPSKTPCMEQGPNFWILVNTLDWHWLYKSEITRQLGIAEEEEEEPVAFRWRWIASPTP